MRAARLSAHLGAMAESSLDGDGSWTELSVEATTHSTETGNHDLVPTGAIGDEWRAMKASDASPGLDAANGGQGTMQISLSMSSTAPTGSRT